MVSICVSKQLQEVKRAVIILILLSKKLGLNEDTWIHFLNHMIGKRVKKKKKKTLWFLIKFPAHTRDESACSSASLMQIFMPAHWVKDVVSGYETIVVFPCEAVMDVLGGCTSVLTSLLPFSTRYIDEL